MRTSKLSTMKTLPNNIPSRRKLKLLVKEFQRNHADARGMALSLYIEPYTCFGYLPHVLHRIPNKLLAALLRKARKTNQLLCLRLLYNALYPLLPRNTIDKSINVLVPPTHYIDKQIYSIKHNISELELKLESQKSTLLYTYQNKINRIRQVSNKNASH
jgi:hypothetical protein